MSEPRTRAAGVLTTIVLFLAAFAVGGGLGYALAWQRLSRQAAQDDGHDVEADAAAEEDPHVAISAQAFAALGMKIGRFPRRDFVRHVTIPGVVQEMPGKSNLSVSAPATGVVEEVLATAGQAVQANEPLFRVRITDEKLADAQTALLEAVAKLRTVEAEIARVEPLVESGERWPAALSSWTTSGSGWRRPNAPVGRN